MVLFLGAGGASAYLTTMAGRAALSDAVAKRGMVARLDALLFFHTPFESWWWVLLSSLLLISITAYFLSEGASRVGRGAAKAQGMKSFGLESLKAASQTLSPTRVVKGGGRFALLRGGGALSFASSMILVGGLLSCLALAYVARGSALGEILLRAGVPNDELSLLGSGGRVVSRGLPRKLTLLEAGASKNATIRLDGGTTVELEQGVEKYLGA